jgi:hypothetical protein
VSPANNRKLNTDKKIVSSVRGADGRVRAHFTHPIYIQYTAFYGFRRCTHSKVGLKNDPISLARLGLFYFWDFIFGEIH